MRFCTLCRRSVPSGATICSFDGHPLTGEIAIDPTSDITIAGYRLLDVVAHGAAGTVYRGEDSSSGSRVTLKLLSQELCSTAAVMHRVRRETKNAIKLANPNVARVLDCGDYEGRFFVVREWLEGHPLSVVLKEEGRLAIDRAGAIAYQMCAALGLIHRVGLVHRDLKPNHIFVANNGETGEWMVKLIDIGIAAKVVNVESTRDIYGTPAYLSPEQAEGKLVSFRSDLYSLGCILFEMLSGSPIFSGSDQELKDQHQTTSVPNITTVRPDTPQQFAQLVSKLLAKQASARPFSAAMVQRELERVVPNCKLPLAPVMTGRGGVVASSPPSSVSPQPQASEGLGMADTLFGGALTTDDIKAAGVPMDGASTTRGLGPEGASAPTPAPAGVPGPSAATSPAPGFIPVPGVQQSEGGGKRTIMGLPVITPAEIEARRVAAEMAGEDIGQTAQGAAEFASPQMSTSGQEPGVVASSPTPQASPAPQTSEQNPMAATIVVDPSMGAMPGGAMDSVVGAAPPSAPAGDPQQMYSAGPAMQPGPPQETPPTTDELQAEFKSSSNKTLMIIVLVIVVIAIFSTIVGFAFCAYGSEPELEDDSHVPSAMLMQDQPGMMPWTPGWAEFGETDRSL